MRNGIGLDRLERAERGRRTRAHNHLTRLRQRERHGPLQLPRRLVLVVLGVAALAGFGAMQLWLAIGGGEIAAIAVRGASRLSPGEVAAATGIPRGAQLAEIEPERVEQALESHDWIAAAHAAQLPGGRLVVEIEEREARALLAAGERRFAIDASGAAFAELGADEVSDQLPRLLASQPPEPGKPDALRAEAAGLSERLVALGIEAPAEIRVAAEGDPQGISLRLPGIGGLVILGREDLDTRLRDLAKLLSARPDELSRAATIDLRFADQAVLRSAAAQDGSQTAASPGGGTPQSTRRSG